MTAEVAILNREAVAVAADSAVTIKRPEGTKVHNTAHKLFQLSKIDPVAVMVYHSADFGGIPWSAIAHEYYRERGDIPYNTVDEHASHFIGYLTPLVRHVPAEDQCKHVSRIIGLELSNLRFLVKSLADHEAAANSPCTAEQIRNLILIYIEYRIEQLNQNEPVAGISESLVEQLINNTYEDWGVLVDEGLGDLPKNDTIVQSVKKMVCASLMIPSRTPWSSGIVVTGFGRKEWFPALSHYVIDGVIANKVRSLRIDGVQITNKLATYVCPFAQTDTMTTFIDGISPAYTNDINDLVKLQLNKFQDWTLQRVNGLLQPTSLEALEREMEDRKATAIAETESAFTQGMLSNRKTVDAAVKTLPKESLAEIAESLVTITSHKHRVSLRDETVGGPVDVALMTKGGGFTWIKHKTATYRQGLSSGV